MTGYHNQRKSIVIPIEDDWYIETGEKLDDSGQMYFYLLHNHDHSGMRPIYSIDKTGITVPDPTERERICAGCNKRVPAHIAGLLMLCRWEI